MYCYAEHWQQSLEQQLHGIIKLCAYEQGAGLNVASDDASVAVQGAELPCT